MARKRLGRVVATTKPDPEEAPRWGARIRTRSPKTTARQRRGEPDGSIFYGTRRYW
jgi:hypothetical protein